MIYHTMCFWKVSPPDIASPTLLHFTDSESFIKNQWTLHPYGETWYPKVNTWHHEDNILKLQQAEAYIWPINCKLAFVPSHQDKDTAYKDLSPEAKLNKQCGELCNVKLIELRKNNRRTKQILFPAAQVYLESNQTIHNWQEQKILKRCYQVESSKYNTWENITVHQWCTTTSTRNTTYKQGNKTPKYLDIQKISDTVCYQQTTA